MDIIVKEFQDKGCTVLTTAQEYETSTNKQVKVFIWKIKAACGCIIDITLEKFRNKINGKCTTCNKQNTKLPFDVVKQKFNDIGATLLTTNDEYISKKMTISDNYFMITYECSHPREVRYHDFTKYKQPCIQCNINKESKSIIIDKTIGDNYMKTFNNEIIVYNNIKELLKEFNVIMLNYESIGDYAVSLNNTLDEYIIISKVSGPSCKLPNNFKDQILYCNYQDKNWFIDPNSIEGNKSFKITAKKFEKYCTQCPIELITILIKSKEINKYKITDISSGNIMSHKVEKPYVNIRIEKIPLDFCVSKTTHLDYDFIIGKYKIQEMVCNTRGIINLSNCKVGSASFYWIHFMDMKTFYIIPENILIDNGYIKEKKILQIIPELIWIQDYLYQYDNLDIEKLKTMFI